jgi:outer membrane usher protein
VQLGALWNTNVTTVNAELARTAQGENGLRASVGGAVGWAAGSSFLARPLTEGFALVDVGDVDGVRVLRDNSLVGQTNRSGRATVPSLVAYADNRLHIEPRDVPLDVRLGGIDAVVSPYYRSPVVVSFVAKREQPASFVAVRRAPSGDVVLPVGTMLFGAPQPLLVGHDGIVYIVDLTEPLRLRAKINGGPACYINLPVPSERSPLLDLGALPCLEETN